jgi:hypothetical protein
VVAAFSYVKTSLQQRPASNVVGKVRHNELLGKIPGCVFRDGSHGKHHGQGLAVARQFLEWYGNLIPGMKSQIEAENWLHGSHGAREILFDLFHLENGLIAGEEIDLIHRVRIVQKILGRGSSAEMEQKSCGQNKA